MFILYDKNYNKIDLPKGMIPLDIYVSSLEREVLSDRIEGDDGIIKRGHTDVSRPIELKVGMLSYDTQDYRLLRDALNSLFYRHPTLFVAEKHQPGKVYGVSVNTSFIPERLTQRMAEARVQLDINRLPYAQSIGTTADITANGVNAEDELWGYGMGLVAEDLTYAFNSTSFSVYNAGDVTVHPFNKELKITISNTSYSTEYLQLKNTTNGSVFRVNESVGPSAVVEIEGPVVTRDGLQYLRQTNRQFIYLDPGWNEFELTGVINAEVDFDFRFYYL